MKNKKRISTCLNVLGMVIILNFLGFGPAFAAESPPAQPVAAQQPAAAATPPVMSNEVSPPALENKNEVVIGLNAPELGPYGREGLAQRRAAGMAVEEINAEGGILGKKIKLVERDTKSNPRIAKENAIELFDTLGAQMIFGGASSAVAQAVGKVAKMKEKIFFATSAYSTDITVEEGHKYLFRECSNSRMAARVLSGYLKKNFAGKNYFYVTVDYNWGWTTEDVFRKSTETTDKYRHRSFLTNLGTFAKVATGAKKVGEIVGEIKAASFEQAQGIDQINKAITEMEKIVRKNAANAEESASASEEMSAQAETLKGFVGQLASLVDNRRNNFVRNSGLLEKDDMQFIEMKGAQVSDD